MKKSPIKVRFDARYKRNSRLGKEYQSLGALTENRLKTINRLQLTIIIYNQYIPNLQ